MYIYIYTLRIWNPFEATLTDSDHGLVSISWDLAVLCWQVMSSMRSFTGRAADRDIIFRCVWTPTWCFFLGDKMMINPWFYIFLYTWINHWDFGGVPDFSGNPKLFKRKRCETFWLSGRHRWPNRLGQAAGRECQVAFAGYGAAGGANSMKHRNICLFLFFFPCGYGSIPIDTFLVGWTSINPSYFGVH